MAEAEKSKLRLEIAHVLFIDIVGYSKLRINDQSEQIQRLREIVRGTEQFCSAEAEGKLLRLPTGDGGALVFRNNPEAPVLCALEIAKALKDHPELRVRMGIHSGPVNEVTDLNEQANIAGAGINIAQRIMDCGDAGHILVSKHAAEDLEQYDQWQPYLHDLGQCEVKHGERLQVVNLYTNQLGNPSLPAKFQHAARSDGVVAKPRRLSPALSVILSLIALAMVSVIFAPAIIKLGIPRSREAVRSSGGEDERRSVTSPPVPKKSIAVLPFENLSSDKENAYFAEGIQDEILTRLSKIAALKVISRTSTQKYKSAPDNLREVGKQLGVANLLEGSIQKVANAVHVNVQLIRAATDEHLWAESYNRKLDDVFGVEGEVASAIAEQLNAKLTGAEQKAVVDKPTQNTAAYDAYLHGLSLENTQLDTATARQAAAGYARAVQIDPNFALAWARLAIIRSYLYFNGIDPSVNSGAAVKEAADRAFALQPELGEAWVAQGIYRYRVLRRFPEALQSYEEALKRLPNSSLVFEQMAHLERRLGQTDAAEKHYQAAAQLDPRNLEIPLTLADLYQSVRRFKEAKTVLDHVLQISPGNERAIAIKAFVLQSEGRLDESAKELGRIEKSKEETLILAKILQSFFERQFDAVIAQIRAAPSSLVDDPRTILLLGYCQERAGHKSEAHATFERVIATIQPSPASVVPIDARELPCYLALAYADLGEKEKALEQARRAVVDYQDDILARPFAEQTLAQIQAYFGDLDAAIAALPHLLEMPNGTTHGDLRFSPFWDPLRKDPRFAQFITEPQSN